MALIDQAELTRLLAVLHGAADYHRGQASSAKRAKEGHQKGGAARQALVTVQSAIESTERERAQAIESACDLLQRYSAKILDAEARSRPGPGPSDQTLVR